MKTLIALLLAACFVAPYLGAPGGVESEHASVTGRWAGAGEAPVISPYPVGAKSVASFAPPRSARLAAVTRQGLVSWVAPRYGRFYLALPYPRGTVGRICGAGGCVTRTSTDYGPSQRIHPDRIADLSAVDFEHVCAVPRRFGLCNATLTILKRGTGPAPRAIPTAPATDQEGTE